MKSYIILLFSICTLSLQSQWLWDFGVNVSAANYLGDIGGGSGTRRGFVSDLKLAKTRWNFGGFVRYKWRPKISLKLAVDYLRLEGDDKLSSNPGRRFRNFNFRNDIYDVGFTGEYFFYENNDIGNTYRYRNGFRAYIFAGVGGFFSNPKTYYKGEWVALQPLATEGFQYRSFVMNIPMGVGFYFTLNKKNRIGFEINYRKTFTDYIDDISGNYPDKAPTDYDPGIILRTPELKETDPALYDSNPSAVSSHNFGGYKRGDSQHKDSYLTMGLSYSYVLRGKSSFYRTKSGGFFSKKRKMRKIRAKF
ncbi:DUF6089 family protein [Aurantibacillus circumpalustris]|uniref:DUF6089 family protein n=1 Tax=Aurantibacillus circumpalustris TaxID=3036359 RepID=UPI00295BC3A0|nr:DUF6089 family protein [Aurantibacillus circumpalustris]